MILVSACLAGIACRYNGSGAVDELVLALVREGKALPLCPEILGGLPVPRTPCEIVRRGGDSLAIAEENGTDRTGAFLEGARKTAEICRIAGIGEAILKSGSPSCGSDWVYDGTFSGKHVPGRGVTSDLLLKEGIRVYSEKGWREKK